MTSKYASEFILLIIENIPNQSIHTINFYNTYTLYFIQREENESKENKKKNTHTLTKVTVKRKYSICFEHIEIVA